MKIFIALYLVPLVIYWLIVLRDRIIYGKPNNVGDDAMFIFFFNVMSFIPVLNWLMAYAFLSHLIGKES